MIFNLTDGAAEPKLTSIAITTQPTKKTYDVGESFSKAGMVVTAYFDDGTDSVVTNYTYSPTNVPLGSSNITISYTHEGITKIATVSVTGEYQYYTYGTENVAWTVSGYGSKQSNHLLRSGFKGGSTGSYNYPIRTTNKVSLTNVKTLKFLCDVSLTGSWGGYVYFVAKSDTSTNGTFDASTTICSDGGDNGTNKTISVNVTGLSGSYYIGMLLQTLNGGTSEGTVKVYKVWGV